MQFTQKVFTNLHLVRTTKFTLQDSTQLIILSSLHNFRNLFSLHLTCIPVYSVPTHLVHKAGILQRTI